MTEPDLKPCPFCGEMPSIVKTPYDYTQIDCSHGFRADHIVKVIRRSEEAACDIWNTRASVEPDTPTTQVQV